MQKTKKSTAGLSIKRARKKKTVKGFDLKEKAILRKGIQSGKSNSVVFVDGRKPIRVKTNFGVMVIDPKKLFKDQLSSRALMQRLNPKIRYKK